MPEPSRWLCLLTAISLAGCQSTEQGAFSWFPFQRDRDAKAAEFAALNRPLANATAAPEIDPAVVAKSPATSGGPAVAVARVDSLVDAGVQAIREQRLDAARQSFNEVLQLVPDHATAHHGLAMIGDLTENWSESEYHYKQALRLRPRDAGLLNDLGYSYLLQNRFHEASRYLNQAADIDPQHEKAQENLAMLSLRQGNRTEAEERLQRLYPATTARQHLARLDQQLQKMNASSAVAGPAQTLAAGPGDADRPDPTAVSGSAGADSALARTGTTVPPNATLEEVRALAERERLAAEQERARRQAGIADYNPPGTPNPAGPIGQPSQLGQLSAYSGSPPGGLPLQQATSSGSVASAVAQSLAASQPANWSTPPAAAVPAASPETLMPGQSPAATLGAAPAIIQPAGDIVAVGASGAFQRTTTASMSQPGGGMPAQQNYAQPAVLSQPYDAPQPQAGHTPSGHTMSAGLQQAAAAAPAGGHFPLAGLNAGPGAIFPISYAPDMGHPSPAPGSSTPPASAPAQPVWPQAATAGGPPTAIVSPGTVSPATSLQAGTGSMINGAMYPPPPQILPAQQWAQQMQAAPVQAAQALPGQPSLSAHTAAGAPPNGGHFAQPGGIATANYGGPDSAAAAPGNLPAGWVTPAQPQAPAQPQISAQMPVQPQTPAASGMASGYPASAAAAPGYPAYSYPGSSSAPPNSATSGGGSFSGVGSNQPATAGPQSAGIVAPNPLSAYERQLQQLNSEYNQTLQQMNRQNPTAAAVQAQY